MDPNIYDAHTGLVVGQLLGESAGNAEGILYGHGANAQTFVALSSLPDEPQPPRWFTMVAREQWAEGANTHVKFTITDAHPYASFVPVPASTGAQASQIVSQLNKTAFTFKGVQVSWLWLLVGGGILAMNVMGGGSHHSRRRY